MFRLNTRKAQRVLGQLSRGCYENLYEADWPIMTSVYWNPVSNKDDLYMLIEAAQQDSKLIEGGPGENLVYLDAISDSDGDYFYWAVDIHIPGAVSSVRVSDFADEVRHLTTRETFGADAALQVLRRGVEVGNQLLRRLNTYVTAVQNGGNDAGTDRSDSGST